MLVYTNRSRLSAYVPSGAYLYTTGYVHNRRNGSSYLPHTRTCMGFELTAYRHLGASFPNFQHM